MYFMADKTSAIYDEMNLMHEQTKQKPRLEVLDGLRGVAAFVVAAMHMLLDLLPFRIFGHGYLAVDFFFMLSGFVIDYSYHDRWGKMSILEFFKRRLIRLHPLVILGTLIGAAFYYIGTGGCSNGNNPPWYSILLLAVEGFFMIPSFSKNFSLDFFFLLNGPIWSLLYEYVANIFYALILHRLNSILIGCVTFIGGLLIINTGLSINIFGMIKSKNYSLNMGFGRTKDHIFVGITRLIFPFVCGILLSRLKKSISVKHGFLLCSIITLVFLGFPLFKTQIWINSAFDVIFVLLVSPILILIGAVSKVRGIPQKICKFLGDLSYPFYITHFPMTYVFMKWRWCNRNGSKGDLTFQGLILLLVAIATSYVSLKLYDEPLQKWLKGKYLQKQNELNEIKMGNVVEKESFVIEIQNDVPR